MRILAMMLKTDEETYLGIEAGDAPPDELLRRICTAYSWNYHELKDLLVAQVASAYRPHLNTPPSSASGVLTASFRSTIDDLTDLFDRLLPDEQKSARPKVELIRDTIRRHQQKPS